MKKFTFTFIIISVLSFSVSAQVCDCIDYLYINEPQTDNVYKYQINADGTLTNGYNFLSGIDSPHGLGVDLNGNLYIGETSNNGDIWKVTCNGDVLATDYIIDTGHNFASVDNILYVSGRDVSNLPLVRAYDLCTGDAIGTIELCDDATDDGVWGFSYNPVTGLFYGGERGGDGSIYIFSPDYLTNGTCVPTAFNAPHLAGALGGVTSDEQGNIYVASNNGFEIVKFDPNGNVLASSGQDPAEDGVGWWGMSGLVYNSFCNCLYSSARTDIDDCISLWDTDLNYLGAAIPPQPGGDDNRTKAINVTTECCPTNNMVTVDTTVCVEATDAVLFLSDLIGCDGPVCEGVWAEEVGNDPNLTYNSCDNSISVPVGTDGCGTYSLGSAGLGNNFVCGAFLLTVNLCISCEAPCPPVNCINQYGEFTIQKNKP